MASLAFAALHFLLHDAIFHYLPLANSLCCCCPIHRLAIPQCHTWWGYPPSCGLSSRPSIYTCGNGGVAIHQSLSVASACLPTESTLSILSLHDLPLQVPDNYRALSSLADSPRLHRPYIMFLFIRADVCRRLPSDSVSPRTPLSLAVAFPLSGRLGDLHPLEYAHAGRTIKKSSECIILRTFSFFYSLKCTFLRILAILSFWQLWWAKTKEFNVCSSSTGLWGKNFGYFSVHFMEIILKCLQIHVKLYKFYR